MKLEHTSHVHLARFIVLILCTILSELGPYKVRGSEACEAPCEACEACEAHKK